MQFSSNDIAYRAQDLFSTMKKAAGFRESRARKLTSNELLKRYAAGERDFPGIDLSDQILQGVNLTGVNLSQAKLYGTQLQGANLTGIDLSRAELCQVDLTGANLTGANLTGANLHQVKLQEANLRGVDLSEAHLSETVLVGTDLGGAILPDGSILLTSKLSSRLHFPKL